MTKREGRITVERGGAVGTLIIDSPDRRNAFSSAMWRAMPGAVGDLASDSDVRVIVVRGAGDKAFSAGADISEFKDLRSSSDAIAAYAEAGERAYAALRGVDKPTIAMIQGACGGGGCEVALLCDIRIAAADARFGVTPAKLGLGYKLEDVSLLVDAVGAAGAKEILFTGRLFAAEEARVMGIVNRVVPAAELMAYVAGYAADIAANAPLTVKACKVIIGEAVKAPAERDADLCQRMVDACYASADYLEGQRAFAEKRKPDFKGR